MRTTVLSVSLFLLSVVSFIACSDDKGDTEKPLIELNAPAEGAVLKIGSDVHFDMDLSDNEGLRSYKVEIHNNFDNHGHTKAESSGETVDFVFNRSWDVSGNKNKYEHHHDIVIPSNATPGAYHFMVYCTDETGNESYVARNITLSHDGEEGGHSH